MNAHTYLNEITELLRTSIFYSVALSVQTQGLGVAHNALTAEEFIDKQATLIVRM